MRLLDKNTIVQQKSLERKLEIDEGIKLANKVDTLRRVSAEEEKKLNTFREESLRKIREDIVPLAEKKVSLENEILVLEGIKKKLREPLDSEWLKVEEGKKVLAMDRKVLDEQKDKVFADFKELDNRRKKIEIEERRQASVRASIERELEEAVLHNGEAKKVLSESRKEADAIVKSAQDRLKLVVDREANVAARERDIINTKEVLAKKEKDLNLRELALQDKYKQLEITQTRLKKHG